MFLRIFKCSGEIEKKAINVDPPIIEILLLQSAQSFGGQLKKPKVSSGTWVRIPLLMSKMNISRALLSFTFII